MSRLFFVVIVCISLVGCSQNGAYGSEEAIKRGDIVYQNEVINVERFEQFLINVSKKKKDIIRITGYTHEGDPILQDLQFDGKIIQYRYDNSHDEFAGTDRGVETDTCTEITEEENAQGGWDYLISGCSTDFDHFLIHVEEKIHH